MNVSSTRQDGAEIRMTVPSAIFREAGAATLVEADYSRDDHGRFASKGGGHQGGKGDPHVSGAGIQQRVDRAQKAGTRKAQQKQRFGGKAFMPFSGQGVVGKGPNKMHVLPGAQIRDIFSKAGKRAGRATESWRLVGPVRARMIA